VRLDGAELVFAGYGVEAPEYGWDDFKGVDLAGKAMLVLVGDPPVPDAFRGSALTYHGRWTCKLEQAARRGAAACLIVHDTAGAGYPFSVVQGRPAEAFELAEGEPHAGVEGWLSEDAARTLLRQAGHDLDDLRAPAVSRAFEPVALGAEISIGVENTIRRIDSRNVIGVLPGADPAVANECVVYTAHWDHLGVGAPIDGQTVRHGARDNAVAVASLLELARRFVEGPRPRRSIVFLAVTAEETGLLGTSHYVHHPRFALDGTLAALNFECPNVYGLARDLIVVGRGASDLDDFAAVAASRQGRALMDDPAPDQGWYYRSDHFPFARAGVPAMWAAGGGRYVDKPADYWQRKHVEFVTRRYHKPADVITEDWDLAGAVQDIEIYHEIGRAVADGDGRPAWKPGSEWARGAATPAP